MSESGIRSKLWADIYFDSLTNDIGSVDRSEAAKALADKAVENFDSKPKEK